MADNAVIIAVSQNARKLDNSDRKTALHLSWDKRNNPKDALVDTDVLRFNDLMTGYDAACKILVAADPSLLQPLRYT